MAQIRPRRREAASGQCSPSCTTSHSQPVTAQRTRAASAVTAITTADHARLSRSGRWGGSAIFQWLPDFVLAPIFFGFPLHRWRIRPPEALARIGAQTTLKSNDLRPTRPMLSAIWIVEWSVVASAAVPRGISRVDAATITISSNRPASSTSFTMANPPSSSLDRF